ncbi:hypothetical protein E2C01_035182 [Portunus trituberculatus]|uniref:Uncharacterized protein n=1 Tax=Portunus trituberculatus TaxID=210409 RepID=A0A5B7F511_PORTR|nr:hypothetical protein [Portunus trituberculatus]
MEFVVEHGSKDREWLGKLGGVRSQPDSIHTTPLSLVNFHQGRQCTTSYTGCAALVAWRRCKHFFVSLPKTLLNT